MKAVWVACALFLAFQARLFAAPFTAWNFNSVPPDSDTATGSLTPYIGYGTATNIGLVSSAFVGGGGADPATTDDTCWRTGNYPAQNFGNKTGGVQFNVSTEGYSNIVIRWDQQVSSTAGKYYRLQYATNGISFYDYPTPITMADFKGFEPQTNSLTAIPEVNNNPNFAFRIVSEWESTAIGSLFNGYATLFPTNNYNQGTLSVRFEYVALSGTLIPGGNTPPFITGPADQTVRVGQSTEWLQVTISDADEPATNLVLHGSSSNPAIVASSNIVFGGSSSSRTVNVTASNQPGVATVTIWVVDTGGKSNSTAFNLTVLPANTAPFISAISHTNTLMNTSVGPIPFTVGDAESPAASLDVSVSTANPALMPAVNIFLGGSGSNRTVSLTPATGQFGVAPITLSVSDGTNTAASSFAVMVVPSASIIFYDTFDYPNGSLLTNSGFLWDSRSGTFGQCQVANHQVLIAGATGEDVDAPLAGAPYYVGSNTTLYAAFKVTFRSLPNEKPDYFAHFTGGSTFRGRLYATAPTNIPAGNLRLQIANNTNTTELGSNLTTNTSYTVVLRFQVDTPATTLWLNPALESSPNVTANDSATAVAITSFGFRQDSGVGGDVLIDDVKAGLTFAAVTSTNAPPVAPILLQFQRIGNNFVLSWSNAVFSLQAAPSLTGTFTNVSSASSPYTNSLTGPTRFFRLKAN